MQGGVGEKNYQGTRGSLEGAVTISWICTYVETFQFVHFKNVQFFCMSIIPK